MGGEPLGQGTSSKAMRWGEVVKVSQRTPDPLRGPESRPYHPKPHGVGSPLGLGPEWAGIPREGLMEEEERHGEAGESRSMRKAGSGLGAC